ncbi:hypothetical protein BJ165DRAFT_1535169 [Panaeolus papilionaceus]|nr:hypothetical protein BJ165DRAFT_1535169 [Panaeolus papilionaceus]
MSTIPEFATKLKYITVSGTVSVEQVSRIGPIDEGWNFAVFVLLGPTGSGKSTFIESLAPNTSLGLSSNKLEGFTQSVNIYRIVNIKVIRMAPIYLVDVPGFADTKISSMGIVSMLRKMIWTNDNTYFRILYFTPIHNPRLPRSQRRVLRTFEALTGPMSAGKITIVSMMWDLVWGESASRRAESNFSELRDKIWENYISSGSDIVRFQNTQESALTILDAAFDQGFLDESLLHSSISQPLQQTPFASDLYNDLQIQIQGLQLQQTNIQSDLQNATEQSDEQLKATLILQFEETQGLLAKFEKELEEFGPAPSSPTPAPVDPVLLSVTPTFKPSTATPMSITPIPTAFESTPVPVAPTPHPPPTSISNLSDPIPGSVTPTPQPSASTPVPVLPTPDPTVPKTGFFGRVVNSVKRLEKKLHRNRDR